MEGEERRSGKHGEMEGRVRQRCRGKHGAHGGGLRGHGERKENRFKKARIKNETCLCGAGLLV
jgi:hypothetical protein